MPDADPSVEDLLDVAVAALGGVRRDGQHQMARRRRGDDRQGRAPARPGRHRHGQVARLPGARRAARGPRERARRRLHGDARAAAPDHHARPAARREGPRAAPAAHRRRIALLKGWHNYVCVHKVAGGYPDDDTRHAVRPGRPRRRGRAPAPARTGASALSESLGEQVLRLREWADETDTGDRDDLVPGRHRPRLAAGVRHVAGVPGRQVPDARRVLPGEGARRRRGRPTSS